MENNEEIIYDTEDGELTHWGIKGQRWGIRRYQNPDGTLTAAGKKRYADEMAKVKERERVVKNKQRTKAKIDKLEKAKRDLKDQEDELDGKKSKGKKNELETLTKEERKARLKTSTNAKEIYANRDMLNNAELQERLNRIDMERRLYDIVKKQTDHVEKNPYQTAVSIAKSVDKVYKGLTESAIGKAAINALLKKKQPTFEDAVANPNNLTLQEINELGKSAENLGKIQLWLDRQATVVEKNKKKDN